MIDYDKAKRQIEAYRTLEKDWDSYDAEPITEVAINRALWLIRCRPHMIQWTCPLVDGGVMVEWSTFPFSLQVEISPHGTFDYSLEVHTFQEVENANEDEIIKVIDLVVAQKPKQRHFNERINKLHSQVHREWYRDRYGEEHP